MISSRRMNRSMKIRYQQGSRSFLIATIIIIPTCVIIVTIGNSLPSKNFYAPWILNPINLCSSSINTQMFSCIFGSTILRRPVVSLSMDSYFNKKEFESFLLKVQYAQKQTNSTTVQKQIQLLSKNKYSFLSFLVKKPIWPHSNQYWAVSLESAEFFPHNYCNFHLYC